MSMPMNDALATWIDGSVWRSRSVAWQALRTMRASPPGAASKGERAGVFRAALEQAQQQLTAAESVGYESRPLNLFYGLSQAGRAIGAAARALTDHYPAGVTPKGVEAPTPWELKLHGITTNTDDVTRSTFPSMKLTPDTPDPKLKRTPSGSFARLACLLSEHCDLSEGMTMAQLWASIPEAVKAKPLTTTSPSVLTLNLEGFAAPDRGDLVKGRLYRWGEPPRQFATALQADGWLSDRTAAAFLDRYPLLARPTNGTPLYRLGRRHHSRAGVSRGSATSLGTISGVCWPLSDEALDSAHREKTALRELTTEYRGRRVVLPRYGTGRPVADEQPLHPLLIWWAILYGLSMLCRYRPMVWTQLIDVNRSPSATAIEHLLDVGLDAVPDLIERTIRQVAT